MSGLFAERRKKSVAPLHGARIEDYAMIGDCQTAALVSRDGSIDWLCWPDFSSGGCFAALLGTKDHGFWKVAPVEPVKEIRRRYRERTMIVETTFETRGGVATLIDFMPVEDGRPVGHSRVIRMIRGVSGKVKMRMDVALRFDYGRTVPWVTDKDGELRGVAGGDMVVLRTLDPKGQPLALDPQGMVTAAEFSVSAGETVVMSLTYCSSLGALPERLDPEKLLTQTEAYWCGWMAKSTFRAEDGAAAEYKEAVERSLITLKALTYAPSGGIVAAVTAGLPEELGGSRNWDYRYCWLRDTALTLLVLLAAGFEEEARAWRRWLLRAIAGSPEQLQTMYGISGERQLTEWTADWLPGYEGSKPVRIGNGAVDQFQLDVFGEVGEALAKSPHLEDDLKLSARAMEGALASHLCRVWPEKDDGIWEVRGARQHFTYSKVMAWVALDRAVKKNERLRKIPGAKLYKDAARWAKNRDLLRKEILDKGFDKKLNSFVQAYGSKALDASCLRIALVGFLPPDDPRIIGTVEAIEKYLMRDGFLLRYDTGKTKDGLAGGEGVFLTCSFWLVTNLWLIGRKEDARALFSRLLALRNDVGLLSEEWDTKAKRMVGNFPQALSHIAMAHAALTIAGEWTPERL